MGHKRRRPPETSTAPLSRQEYFAERQMLLDARQRSYQRAEQLVVGGATGALILSTTFLEKIVPNPVVARPSLLIGAWILLLIGLAASLLGQFFSGKAFGQEIDRLEAYVHGESEPQNPWRALNWWCGAVAAVCLVLGIGLLALFAYINAPFHAR